MWAVIDTSVYIGHWEQGLATANREDFELLGNALRLPVLVV